MNTKNYDSLRIRDIINILDGDTKFGIYQFDDNSSFNIAMPYLSGPDICGISYIFGLDTVYPQYGASSRWVYFDDLLNHCIKNNAISDLLSYLFNIDKFTKSLKHLAQENIFTAHQIILTNVKEEINRILFFSNKELVCINNTYVVQDTISKLYPEISEIKKVDLDYIRNITQRANKDISEGNFDSAITKARTLLEETFIYVIESKSSAPSGNGDIKALYKQTRELYNMHTGKEIDKRINMLLSGLNNVVTGIAEMRNLAGDAHGSGSKRIGVSEYHTRLCLNAATIVADFILSVHANDRHQ